MGTPFWFRGDRLISRWAGRGPRARGGPVSAAVREAEALGQAAVRARGACGEDAALAESPRGRAAVCAGRWAGRRP